MKSIIVCGSRYGAPRRGVEDGMASIFDLVAYDHVVVGSSGGVDECAFEWAIKKEIAATIVPALWTSSSLGRAAGPIRNRRMLSMFKPEAVFAFDGGRGTEDMVAAALFVRVPTWRWVGGHWRPESTAANREPGAT